MRHRATPRFWACYGRLPARAQRQADQCFALLRADPLHPSLHFKPVRQFWSAKISAANRSIAAPSTFFPSVSRLLATFGAGILIFHTKLTFSSEFAHARDSRL